MQKKVQYINPIGIQKDISPAQAKGTQFVHDMYNKRITQNKESNTFAISSEGKAVLLPDKQVAGDVIGVQRIDDYVVYFSVDNNHSYITIWKYRNTTGQSDQKVFVGDFGFNKEHPIESVGIVETSSIIKVYWVDGINPPRMLNINKLWEKQGTEISLSSFYFDFQPELAFQNANVTPTLTVTKLLDGQGYFHSGVVQYAVSYYNQNGQESPVFLQSDIYYVSQYNRGLSPEEYGSNSFAILFDNIDSSYWECIRIYRIFRSSLNATPQVEIIYDCKISELETKTEQEEVTTIDEDTPFLSSLEQPLSFTPGGVTNNSVTGIIFEGKALLMPQNAETSVITLFSDNNKGQLSQFENTITLLDGTQTPAIVFLQDFGGNGDNTKRFTIQTDRNVGYPQIKLLREGYYYILTRNNSGKLKDITKIGMCGTSPYSEDFIPIPNEGFTYFKNGTTGNDTQHDFIEYSGLAKEDEKEKWYTKSITFKVVYTLENSDFPSNPSLGDTFTPSYYPFPQGGPTDGEAPFFVIKGIKEWDIDEPVIDLQDIAIYGVASKKSRFVYNGNNWEKDTSYEQPMSNNMTISQGSYAIISSNSLTNLRGIAVPVNEDIIDVEGGASTTTSICYTCTVPIEAFSYIFIGTGQGQISSLTQLALRVGEPQTFFPVLNLNRQTFPYPYDKIPIDWNPSVTFVDLYKTPYSVKNSVNYYLINSEITTSMVTVSVLNFKDTGTTGISYDYQALLLKGLTNLIPYTVTHKDNTLFLGNYSTEGNSIRQELKNFLSNKDNYSLGFVVEDTGIEDEEGAIAEKYHYVNQLEKGNSYTLTHFRCGQVYRIGIQLMNKKGQWSEVVYLEDKRCDIRITPNKYNDTVARIPKLQVSYTDLSSVASLLADYIGIRLVYVEPTILDRNVLCQGIACSTVYNFKSRYKNQVFAQASWFARPEFYGSEQQFFEAVNERVGNPRLYEIGRYPIEEGSILEWRMIGRQTRQSLNTVAAQTYNGESKVTLLGLPEQTQFNAEIQGHSRGILDSNNPLTSDINTFINYHFKDNNYGGYMLEKQVENREQLINYYNEDFGIDRTILTLHSPEIEWDENIKQIDLNSYNIRVLGFVPVKRTLSDILIQSEGSTYGQQQYGFIKNVPQDSSYKNGNDVYLSGKGLISYPFWIDDNAERTTWQEDQPQDRNSDVVSFVIYPWHRNGALNNQGNQDVSGVKARLLHKVMSNLRICLSPYYDSSLSDLVLPTEDKKLVIDNDFVQSYALNYKGFNKNKIYYQGNVDLVLQGNKYSIVDGSTFTDYGYPISMYGFAEAAASKVDLDNIQKNISGGYNRGNWYASLSSSEIINQRYLNSYLSTYLAYLSNSATMYYWDEQVVSHGISTQTTYNTFPSKTDKDHWLFVKNDGSTNPGNLYSYDSVSMKYKSGNHLVFALKETPGTITQFPSFVPDVDLCGYQNYEGVIGGDSKTFFNAVWQNPNEDFPNISWDLKGNNYTQLGYGSTFFYYPVVELYKENIDNQYRGTTKEALSKNVWIPISAMQAVVTTNLVLETTAGDTYFQRYDHLKTQPYTQQDQNSIVEIVSFPVETYINIDGRYDENRGLESNLIVNKNNFNQLNTVYSQTNNYFGYNSYKNDKVTNKFPNQFTWSLEKVMGEEIDSWTNLTLLNTYDLDGDKGPIQYLERFNDQIYAFQDTGLARIVFNPRVQINTSDGIPVELSNSKKLEGVVYISDTVGNQNKWAIAKGKTGIFFVDKINESFNKFNGQTIESLTDKHFNRSFIENCSQGIWNFYSTEAVNRTRVLYESNTGDYYIQLGNSNWISYNENLGTFTSRYSYDMHFLYELPPYEYTSGNQILSINNVSAHTIKGNSFSKMNHNNSEPLGTYSTITLVANDNFPIYKVFETVEFRSNDTQQFEDVIGPNPEKNPLHVWVNKPVYRIKADNEYQHSDSNNSTDKNVEDHFKTSWLRKKFRVWRAQIPRNNRERIRNMWSYITLYSNIQTSLYDFNIVYYI